MKAQSNYSILQAVLAPVIFLSYFLPWVSGSIYGERIFSVSFMNAIIQTEKLSRGVSDIGTFFGEDIKNYAILLFIIPILSFINAIIQWMGRFPIFAFYSTVLPVVAAFSVMGILLESGGDGLEMMGIGAIVALIAGVISIIAAWTCIGRNYGTYKGFIKTITIWFALSVVWWIVLGFMAKAGVFPSFEFMKTDTVKLIMISVYLIGLIMSIGTLHLPFIIYAWILVGISKAFSVKTEEVVTTAGSLPQDSALPQEKEATRDCPQCDREISLSTNFCPYCGCDVKETTEEKRVKDENLRFAPPQYRDD